MVVGKVVSRSETLKCIPKGFSGGLAVCCETKRELKIVTLSMEQPLTEMGKAVGEAAFSLVQGKDQKFTFGDVKWEMPTRHAS